MNTICCRPTRRLFVALISILLMARAHAQAPQLTTINDVVYRANGAPASGSVVISWPAFSTADQRAVAAGEIAFPLATGGVLNVNLAPNEAATPSGSYYKVVYKLSDRTTSTEYWVVPATSPASISAIRSSVVPRTMAAQLVTRQYVDNVLQGNDVTLVHRSGSESITGVKAFNVSPTVPTPASSTAVANKSYVDAAVTAVSAGYLNKSGDSMLGALTLVGDPVATNQAANKHYVDLTAQNSLTALGQKLDRANDAPTVLAGIRFGSQFANLQAAITDAGTNGAMFVNPDYPGIDSYTNPNNIALLDMRAGGNFQLAEVDAKKVGNVRQCHKFPGANAGAKIAACIADLPATGGTADACGFEGPQTISSTIAVNKRTTLRVCAAQFTASVTPAFNVTADFFVDGANRIASTFKAASGGVIFQGGGTVKYFGLKNLTLNGNGSGSKALVTPAFGGGVDWSAGRISLTNNLVQDFGDYAFDLGQSTYFVDISESLFFRNIGSVNAEWASDFTIKNSNFALAATNATYPSGRPQVRSKGGSTFTIADSDFERNDALNPTGKFQAPDILLEATSPSGAPGYGWIRNNKFGNEGDSSTRAKIQVASSSGSTTDAVHNVVIAQNSFYGAPNGGSQVAIKIDNPINRFRITQNYFAAFRTLIADNAALASSDVGHSSFDATNVIVPIGGSSPTSAVTIFANGGRYFSNIADVGNTDLLPVDETPRDNETSELRNRAPNSENLSAWSATGVTVTPGQTDPFGTTRASLLTAAGSIAAEQIFATLDNSNRTSRLVVKFWAKAGTLNTLQAGIYQGTAFQGSFPLFTLGNTWKQYKFVYNGLDTATAHVLRIYPGNGSAVTGGNIYMFGVQVSDVDSDYVPTAGAAVAKTDTGNRYERKAEFANQIVSTVATGTAPLSVNSTTKVANLNADTVDGLNASELGGIPKPNTRRWAYIATTGGSMSSIGEAQTVGTGSCGNSTNATNTEPAMNTCTQTAATLNTVAGLQGAAGLWRTGRNISMQWAGKVRENASVRAWIGMTDQTLATMVGSDNPAGNYAAFRFSTSASDANVKCVTKDNSTQNIQSTAIADLSTYHTYEIAEDVANARWRFYIDGAEVCGSGLTANLPAANTNLRFVAGQQNLVATQRNIDSGWVYVSADK